MNKDEISFLYAFEDLFFKKCRAVNINPGLWKQGMWTAAHGALAAHKYGQADALEAGMSPWFAHVQRQSAKTLK